MSSSKNGTNEIVVPPSIEPGFARWRGVIFAGIVFLTIIYGIVYTTLRESTLVQPDQQFCPGDEPCFRPDLFAFQMSSAVVQVFMGSIGLVAWHVSKSAHSAKTPQGRLFGFLRDADRLNAGIMVFQIWDFFASLSIPEHATAVFLAHHAMAAITAYYSLEYQLVHHYAIFFGGCSEISTIFLVFCDLDVYFPAFKTISPMWGGFIMFCQASFTLCFFYYRVVGWWWVSWRLWSDTLPILKDETAQQFRPGRAWFLRVFLAMDVLLGLLQLYWFFFGIVPKIFEVLAKQES